ncbi:MAG TPA: alkaline phosphatase PhoX [Pyrinomonadaceae bacterium]
MLSVGDEKLKRVGRRNFLVGAAMAGASGLAFDGLVRRAELVRAIARGEASPDAALLGRLAPAATENTRENLLSLPEGFHYTVIGQTGDKMSDGHPTPHAHDGMAAFEVNGQLRLVRNHEVNRPVGVPGAAIGPNAYDPLAGGGTTTLIIDPRKRTIIRDFVSLSGTLINCAGGPTPWGSWISCEETVLGPEKFKTASGQEQGGFSKPHGYCFDVPAAANEPVNPVPLKAMGRFVHEAIAVDPRTGIVYLTEDKGHSGFYRFIPKEKGRLAAGGKLQMLAIKGRARYDTRTQQKPGEELPVAWVDIPDPDPAAAERDPWAVYKQGIAAGAATFNRLEGCLYGRGKIFFSSTDGGDKRLGQVWEYSPSPQGDGTLKLIFEPTDPALLNMPDNLCLTKNGNLIICEDNGTSVHLQLLTRSGQISPVAHNVVPGFETREFAGVTLSPDGQTLFVNVQIPGMTFAIWGPWDKV